MQSRIFEPPPPGTRKVRRTLVVPQSVRSSLKELSVIPLYLIFDINNTVSILELYHGMIRSTRCYTHCRPNVLYICYVIGIISDEHWSPSLPLFIPLFIVRYRRLPTSENKKTNRHPTTDAHRVSVACSANDQG